jgi:ABC-2 type transport system permease protein
VGGRRLPICDGWRTMRLLWELAKLSFQRHLTYRAATLAGLLTNLFFGLLRAAVLMALYGARQEVEGISAAAAVTFTGLTQAVIAYLGLFGWYEVMDSVYTGDISSDLLKPMGYIRFWLARDLGRAAVNLALRGVPIMAVYALVFQITVPSSGSQWAALGVALTFSWWLSFAWRFLLNLSAFWTPHALGIGRFGSILVWFLSGFLMPLRFFPDWFVQFCHLTPFPSMVNTVVEVYLGVLTGPAVCQALLLQAVWAAALMGSAHLVLRAGVRHLVIQGG